MPSGWFRRHFVFLMESIIAAVLGVPLALDFCRLLWEGLSMQYFPFHGLTHSSLMRFRLCSFTSGAM